MTLSEHLRELADVIERVQDDDLEVLDADLQGGSLDVGRAQLVVEFTISDETAASIQLDEPEPEPETDDSIDEDDEEDDVDEDKEQQFACDVVGCDYEGNERGLAIHKGRSHAEDESEEPDTDDGLDEDTDIWCDICGAGPFDDPSRLSGHHVGAGHDGDTRPTDEPPDEVPDPEDAEPIDRPTAEPETEDQLARSDGGTAAASTSAGTQVTCQNCGSHVSKKYQRVYTPEHEPAPRVCPACPDKVRESDGSVREVRSSRSAARRVN